MFTKNVFIQKDPIAEAIAKIAEADYKSKMEELKGNQKVLDKNKNNKLDSQDFAILRGEKKAMKEEEQVDESSPFDWKKPREPEVKGGAGIKKGRAYGGAAQKSKPEQDDADDKKKTQKEEVEQVDELNRSTVKSYIDKKMNKIHSSAGTTSSLPGAKDLDSLQRAHARLVGNKPTTAKKTGDIQVDVRNKKVTKNEEVEHLDERTLTKGETKEKERIVKGMKKSLAGFKARYGDRAKSVMYATATKAAKKD